MTDAMHSPRGLSGAALRLALVCSLCALPGCGGGASPEHTKAVARFQQLGGRVNLRDGGYEVDLAGTEVSDEDIAQLQHVDNLKAVDLRRTTITPKAIDYLRAIKTLEVVQLANTDVTAEDVKSLEQALPGAVISR
jgi:hypothetical protein